MGQEPQIPRTPTEQSLQKADALFKAQNFAEAREEYDHARDLATDWRAVTVRLAVQGGVASSLKLKLWDDALSRATEYVEKTKNTYEGALGERFLAGIYLVVPHNGTKQGRRFLRGQSDQGVWVSSWRKDRQTAISHYEHARHLLLALKNAGGTQPNFQRRQGIEALQIGVDFDLAGLLTQRPDGGYGFGYNRWGWMGWWWHNDLDSADDSNAVQEADYEEPHYGYWNQDDTPPAGIPLSKDGLPQFTTIPVHYNAGLGDGLKIRFLLAEIQKIDTSPKKDDAAKALLRWAMIARSLYGPEVITQWNQTQTRTQTNAWGRPVSQQTPKQALPSLRDVWQLGNNETLTIAGGTLRLISLPPSESPVALFDEVVQKYPQSSLVPEAMYSRALYFQTRQQFPQALAGYRTLVTAFPTHARAESAKKQIELIQSPSVALDNGGVNLPGGKPRLTFSYRNTEEISFKATRVDLTKYVQDTLQTTPKASYWDYHGFPRNFFDKEKDGWKKYLGEQIATWKEAVLLPPGNRVGQSSTQAPISLPGAYVVEGGTSNDKGDVTRTLILVTDIAIVQKNLVGKGLIWVADARNGQPLPDKAVRVYEHWQESQGNQNTLHWDSVARITNKDGAIEYTKSHAGSIEAIVTGEDGRMAFSFFQQWSESSRDQVDGNWPRSYVLTDRPVYRPGSVVKFRIWTRDRENREFKTPTAGESIGVTINDAKGVGVKSLTLKTDELGGG